MKKINLLLVLLTLTSCNLNSSKGYEFAHSALDSLLNEVTYDESIEVKNALYHEYDEDSNLNEVVVMYFTYEHSEYGLIPDFPASLAASFVVPPFLLTSTNVIIALIPPTAAKF